MHTRKNNRDRGPQPFDAHVGARLRQRRLLLDLSQAAVAEGLGISFQQVQKYERGANRMSASRLLGMSELLDVPFGWWAEEFDTGNNVPVTLDLQDGIDIAVLHRPDVLRLVGRYEACSDESKDALRVVAKQFAEG